MENRCVICGEIIPEGRQVCKCCEDEIINYKDNNKKEDSINK